MCMCAFASASATRRLSAGLNDAMERDRREGDVLHPHTAEMLLLVFFNMLLGLVWALSLGLRFARRQSRAIIRLAAPRSRREAPPESENDESRTDQEECVATPPIVFLLLRAVLYYVSVTLASIEWLCVGVASVRVVSGLTRGVRCAFAAFLLLGWLPQLVGVAVGSITIAPFGLFAGRDAAFVAVRT